MTTLKSYSAQLIFKDSQHQIKRNPLSLPLLLNTNLTCQDRSPCTFRTACFFFFFQLSQHGAKNTSLRSISGKQKVVYSWHEKSIDIKAKGIKTTVVFDAPFGHISFYIHYNDNVPKGAVKLKSKMPMTHSRWISFMGWMCAIPTMWLRRPVETCPSSQPASDWKQGKSQ